MNTIKATNQNRITITIVSQSTNANNHDNNYHSNIILPLKLQSRITTLNHKINIKQIHAY